MRILHVVAAGEVGGAERMLASLIEADRVNEHAVALFTPAERLARFFAERRLTVFDRGRVLEGPLQYLFRSLGHADTAWLVRTATMYRASVLHLHTFGSQVLGSRAGAQLGIPVVRTEHSTRVYTDPTCIAFSLWSLKRTHTAVAVSNYVEHAALQQAPWIRPRMRVIRNGVDTRYFKPLSAEPPEPRRFVLVGRLEPRKGVDIALSAFARIPDATLDIVGDGPERNSLERMAGELQLTDRVHFHGYMRDTRPVMMHASAVLSSSREEGLGIALLEGMACARPVVGFAVGGVPEIVEHGVTGLMTRGNDSASLERVIKQALALGPDLREFGARARNSVVSTASVEKMYADYVGVYENTVKQ